MNTQEHVHIWLMFYVLLPQLIQLAQARPHDAMHLPSIKYVWSETLMNYFDHVGTEDYVTATFTFIERR